MTLHIPAPEPVSCYTDGTPYVTYSLSDTDKFFSIIKAAWLNHKLVVWRVLPEHKDGFWRCRFAVVDG